MTKLLIGGSPCTYWSIAQKNNRETEPSGMGWELFKNYLVAKEKFKPDYFLYENNKSAAQAIKDEIKKQFGVWDGSFLMEDTGARYIEINSALVSAQNRQRFYVHNCGEVEQPKDRGILLKDVLESGQGWTDKSYAVTTRDSGAIPEDTLKRKRHTMIAEPVNITADGKAKALRASADKDGIRNFIGNENDKRTCVAEPVCVQEQVFGRKASENGDYDRRYEARTDGKSGSLTGTNRQNAIAEPVPNFEYIDYTPRNGSEIRINENAIRCNQIKNNSSCAESFVEFTDKKAQTLTTAHTPKIIDNAEKYNNKPVYEVRNGSITIKGKEYPIKLADGFYIIRKLTVTECCRLQTMPDDYCRAVSNSQAYKGLGNGWTAEVIIHILSHALKDIPRDEKILVLSMYDGIGTGRYCLDKMGFTNVEYHAYEIDKYAMKIALRIILILSNMVTHFKCARINGNYELLFEKQGFNSEFHSRNVSVLY